MPGRRDNDNDEEVEVDPETGDGPQDEPTRDEEKESRKAYEEHANAPEEPGEHEEDVHG